MNSGTVGNPTYSASDDGNDVEVSQSSCFHLDRESKCLQPAQDVDIR